MVQRAQAEHGSKTQRLNLQKSLSRISWNQTFFKLLLEKLLKQIITKVYSGLFQTD